MPPRVSEEAILSLLKQRGPLTEGELAKAFGMETLFIGAYLSTLASQGKLSVSRESYRGSKLYYLPGQERAIAERLTQQLEGEEARLIKRLQAEVLLEDDQLDARDRILLRRHPDIVIPLIITTPIGEKLVWTSRLADEHAVRRALEDTRKTIHQPEAGQDDEHTSVETLPLQSEKEENESPLEEEREEERRREKAPLDREEKHEQQLTAFKKKEKEPIVQRQMKRRGVKEAYAQLGHTRLEERLRQILAGLSVERVLLRREKELILLGSLLLQGVRIPVLVHARDKKSISERDVYELLGRAWHARRQPVLVTNGKLQKQARPLEQYVTLIPLH